MYYSDIAFIACIIKIVARTIIKNNNYWGNDDNNIIEASDSNSVTVENLS